MKSLAIAVVVALASPAAAEINMADSVEWQTIDSEVVVRGFVTAVATTKRHGVEWSDATVQITETIKGGVKQIVHVGIRGDAAKVDAWRAAKTDLLLFLVDGKSLLADDRDFGRYPFALRPPNGSTSNPLELGMSKAYTTAFDVLVEGPHVLAAVRTAARSTATTSLRLDVPWDTPAMKALWGGSAVWLTVPVDAALEKLAIQWLGTRERRTEGARALASFKSDANIARMKKLLVDPEFVVETRDAPGARPQKHYTIRAIADDALTAWGVAHTKPTIDEPR